MEASVSGSAWLGWQSGSWYPSVWFAEADDSHLTPPERKPDTEQGIAPNFKWLKFEPLRNAEVTAGSHSANARSGAVEVDTGLTADVFIRSTHALSGANPIVVITSAATLAGTAGAKSGSKTPWVSGSASVAVRNLFARSGGNSVSVSGDCCATARSSFAVARSALWTPCETVRNPTDEEILMLFLTR